MGTPHEDLCTFIVISSLIFRRTSSVPEKSCRENKNTFYIQYLFFFLENHAVEKYGRAIQHADDIIQRMRVACLLTKERIQTH
jgi:hypothetical protein